MHAHTQSHSTVWSSECQHSYTHCVPSITHCHSTRMIHFRQTRHTPTFTDWTDVLQQIKWIKKNLRVSVTFKVTKYWRRCCQGNRPHGGGVVGVLIEGFIIDQLWKALSVTFEIRMTFEESRPPRKQSSARSSVEQHAAKTSVCRHTDTHHTHTFAMSLNISWVDPFRSGCIFSLTITVSLRINGSSEWIH